MPRQAATESAEDRVLREMEHEDTAALEKLAAQAGPPADAHRLSERDEDDAWETTDPQVDEEKFGKMLTTQGIPPDQAQRLLITKLRPDWAPLYSQPTQDLEMAHMLTRVAQYPFRPSVLEGIDDPEQQVRKAETIDRRFQKRVTQRLDAAAQVIVGGQGAQQPDAAGMQQPTMGGQ